MNRREFVTALAASALAGCESLRDVQRSAPAAGARPVGKPRFHVFSKVFQSPRTKSPEELCDLMAAAGYDGVQWTVRKRGHATPENAKTELPRLVKIAAARGLAVETICTGISDGRDPAAETVCRVAADCGIRLFRTGYFFYDEKKETFLQSMDRFKRSFEALSDLAERTGLTAAYQNHSTWGPAIFGASLWDLHECLRDLDPRHIGVEFDPMHAYYENNESWRHGFERIAPWVTSVDLKDFHYQLAKKNPKRIAKKMVAAGDGIGPWAETRRLMGVHRLDPLFILHFEYPLDQANLPKAVASELKYFKSCF